MCNVARLLCGTRRCAGPTEGPLQGRKRLLDGLFADHLGYYLLPAVESLVGDAIPLAEVHNILDRIEPEATKFLATAEMIRRDIQERPITKGQVDALYRLVEDMLRLFTEVHFSTNREAGLRTYAKQ